MRIYVRLPADRLQYGTLETDFGGLGRGLPPMDCYAKADSNQAKRHGNPSRDPTRPFGDTPLGVYRCHVGVKDKNPATVRKYGPHGYIALDPIAGDALIAKGNGRYGLLIHGGDLGAEGRLRATFGCVRLANPDMAKLMAAMMALPARDRRQVLCEIGPLDPVEILT